MGSETKFSCFYPLLTMKLTYRGIPYTANLSAVTSASRHIPGQYRGVVTTISHYDHTGEAQSLINLKYRGAYYRPIEKYRLHPQQAMA